MEKLYIFNPETDLALATNTDSYTPPSNIIRMKERNALLPAFYASPASSILVVNDTVEFPKHILDVAEAKRLNIIGEGDLRGKKAEVCPWGWNKSLRNYLAKKGVPEECLPSTIYLDRLRNLSHRRTTIGIQQLLRERIPGYEIALPLEFFDADEACDWANKNIGSYMKAPWSSSGRGVYHVTEPNTSQTDKWIRGVISRQGSIIGEIGVNRTMDFATEWVSKSKKVEFLGFSIFNVGNHGLYKGNVLASEKHLEKMIMSKTPEWDREKLNVLQGILNEVVAPFYEGPFGVDMLSSDNGKVNLCVEVNLRMTMGHVALNVWNESHREGFFAIEM